MWIGWPLEASTLRADLPFLWLLETHKCYNNGITSYVSKEKCRLSNCRYTDHESSQLAVCGVFVFSTRQFLYHISVSLDLCLKTSYYAAKKYYMNIMYQKSKGVLIKSDICLHDVNPYVILSIFIYIIN